MRNYLVSANSKLEKISLDSRSSDGVIGEQGVSLPLLQLQDYVLFPGNSIPLSSLADSNLNVLKKIKRTQRKVGVITTTAADGEALWSRVGVEAEVSDFLKMPNGETGAVIHGVGRRFYVQKLEQKHCGWIGTVNFISEKSWRRTKRFLVLVKTLRLDASRLVQHRLEISADTRHILTTSDNPDHLMNLLIPYLSLSLEEKLGFLGDLSLLSRMKKVIAWISRELNLQKLADEIHNQIKGDLHEDQRRAYLKEQIMAIRRELGEMEGEPGDGESIIADLNQLQLPKLVRSMVDDELERMQMMSPGMAEYIISFNYLTLVRDLPWINALPTSPKLQQSKRVLDRAHYGLGNVKERILEHLALIQHKGEASCPIILLDGPPGVGKTSLARSIAEALGRPFARISLGGIKDEAEIRGHRRTYLGAMPGKIIGALKQTKNRYTVILLDEMDKIGGEHHQDVSAALLEVLDKEQNKEFLDHYLGVPFDLSNILFIATSNDENQIPVALRDRMELITIPSYTDEEKLEIAKRHLIPALLSEMKLGPSQFHLSDRTLQTINRHYTRESGVRGLQRELHALGRKVVRRIVAGRGESTRITGSTLTAWLGVPRYIDDPRDKKLAPGVAIGLAYTSLGGEILYIETSRSRSHTGEGRLRLTGNIGKVMQESAEAVLSFICAHVDKLGLELCEVSTSNYHIHFPDGGTPKDGPSAGLAIMCAMVGSLLNKSLPNKIAMTGEITLRGRVMAVGGMREKLLAAYRYGKTTVLYPIDNQHDLVEVPPNIRSKLNLVPVATMEEALAYVGYMDSSLN